MTRIDNVGMWWADFPIERTSGPRQDYMRVVDPPPTGWTPPQNFPNLDGVKVIGFDTETKDLELLERGPGGVRGTGHLVGLSVATTDQAWYFPMRHEYAPQSSYNLDPDRVMAWAEDLLRGPALKVGANLLYDCEMVRAAGVTVHGPFYDVQFAEPLLDEHAHSYSLDKIATKYLGQGKETPLLYQWCADSFGGKADGSQRKNIWRAPPSLVGPYAQADALLPLQVRLKQQAQLDAENLNRLLDIEHRLIPLLMDMRFRGVRVDLDAAQQTLAWLRSQAAQGQAQLGQLDVWANAQIAKAFDAAGLQYPLTAAGGPSFTRQYLETVDHPLARNLLIVRNYEKAANPFVESYILGGQVNGRVYTQFHPLRNDEYGTVSGRFSSSNPNLQNIPARDKVLGPRLRGLFVPEVGCTWRRYDYSQIEYRLLAHDALGHGADEIRARYQRDKAINFHRLTLDMVRELTGVELDYKPAKNLNFGMVYGMGKDKTVRSLGTSYDLGLKLWESYHEANPYVRQTYKGAERLVNRRGWIRTLLGRRRRFPEIITNDYGRQVRVGAHKALNARLQGGAADVMKKAMVDCYEAGVFDVLGPPHITVHDELDVSDDGTPAAAQAAREMQHIMETCVTLKVPLLVEVSGGPNWGACA